MKSAGFLPLSARNERGGGRGEGPSARTTHWLFCPRAASTLVRRGIAILPGPPFDRVDDLPRQTPAPAATILPLQKFRDAVPAPAASSLPRISGILRAPPVRLRPSRSQPPRSSNLPQGFLGEVRASASGGGARAGPATLSIPVQEDVAVEWGSALLSRASWRDRPVPRTAGWGRRPSRPSVPSPGRLPGPAPRAGARTATAPPP